MMYPLNILQFFVTIKPKLNKYFFPFHSEYIHICVLSYWFCFSERSQQQREKSIVYFSVYVFTYIEREKGGICYIPQEACAVFPTFQMLRCFTLSFFA